MGTYVVGVDGSKGSVEALRYAIEEARVHDATVKAVNAWHTPAILYESGWAPLPVDYEAYPKQAQEVLDRCLEEVGAAESGVEVTTVVHQGQAADVICEEAKGADLLIVGLARRRRFPRAAARVGQPAVRALRALPDPDRPEPDFAQGSRGSRRRAL